MRFSSTATRAEEPSSSARPSATSRASSAALARLTASESEAVAARASRAAAPPALSSLSRVAAAAACAGVVPLAATSPSSLSNSSQLSMVISSCLRVALKATGWILRMWCLTHGQRANGQLERLTLVTSGFAPGQASGRGQGHGWGALFRGAAVYRNSCLIGGASPTDEGKISTGFSRVRSRNQVSSLREGSVAAKYKRHYILCLFIFDLHHVGLARSL